MENVRINWAPTNQICAHCGKEVGRKVVYSDITITVAVNVKDGESKAKSAELLRAAAKFLEEDAAARSLVTCPAD